jgi:hypothetical protein
MLKMETELLQCLKEGVVVIEFEKVDGTMRTMRATLSENIIPVETTTKEKNPRKKSEESQSVWDIEAEGWRSFRWDRLRSWDADAQ